MDDLISRKAFMSHVEEEYMQFGSDYDIGQVLGDLEDFPSMRSERTGRWRLQTIKGKDFVFCSECGFGVHEGETRRYSYCPNCGAEMIGGRK